VLTQDFRSLQSEKQVSGHCCTLVRKHKGEWMS